MQLGAVESMRNLLALMLSLIAAVSTKHSFICIFTSFVVKSHSLFCFPQDLTLKRKTHTQQPVVRCRNELFPLIYMNNNE